MFSLSLYHCFSRAVVLPVPALELRRADRCGRRNRKGKLLNKRKLYCRRERERERTPIFFSFSRRQTHVHVFTRARGGREPFAAPQ